MDSNPSHQGTQMYSTAIKSSPKLLLLLKHKTSKLAWRLPNYCNVSTWRNNQFKPTEAGQNILGQTIPCYFLTPRTKHTTKICHPGQNIPHCFCHPEHNIPCHIGRPDKTSHAISATVDKTSHFWGFFSEKTSRKNHPTFSTGFMLLYYFYEIHIN